MLAGLSAQQLAEMEAFSAIEMDPEGEEARQAKRKQEEAERLARQKQAFIRALEEPAHGNRSDP